MKLKQSIILYQKLTRMSLSNNQKHRKMLKSFNILRRIIHESTVIVKIILMQITYRTKESITFTRLPISGFDN